MMEGEALKNFFSITKFHELFMKEKPNLVLRLVKKKNKSLHHQLP